jgi:hypothetical protein
VRGAAAAFAVYFLAALLMFALPVLDHMEAKARRFLREHEVDAVVLDERLTGPWPGIMAALGARPVRAGGVLLYRVRV